MARVVTGKIEKKAINVLEEIIDKHPTMDYGFNAMDKELAWDGYIWIYKDNNGGQSKANFDDKLPVQIKGHMDGGQKYINKQRITYPVSLEDLNIYFNDRGVLYFLIFISEGEQRKKEVFYASLFPSKIKGYLEKAQNKRNKEFINIIFTKLKKNAAEMFLVAKQFSRESRTQGFGQGQIVQNTIMLKDLEKVTSITAMADGVTNKYEFLQRFSSGDLCFYGTIGDDPVKFPLEWDADSVLYIRSTVDKTITVEKELYYESYETKTGSNGEDALCFGNNLQLNFADGSFRFKPLGNINGIKRDAEFLLAAFNSGTFCVGKLKHLCDYVVSEEYKNRLQYYIDLSDALSMIEFEYLQTYEKISSQVKEELINLVAMKNGIGSSKIKEKVFIYNWMIEGKYLPLLVFKQDNNQNVLINVLYTKKYFFTQTEEGFRISLMGCVEPYALANLYYYDYKAFHTQIGTSAVNEHTIEVLVQGALKLIQAYDCNNDKNLLHLAETLLERLSQLESGESYFILNQLQIKKRLGTFNENDKKALNNISEDGKSILCGINTLLENKEKAQQFYNEMQDDERRLFEGGPIYFLYQALTS